MSIPITFKEVFTTNVREFDANPNWTITEFIETVKPYMCREFNVSEDNLEIIEAGKYVPGILPEASLPLTQDTNKIKDKWGPKLDVAFYIRRKDYQYPQLNLNLIAPNPTTSTVTDDCPVCLETTSLYSRHTCSHRICNRCHQRCLSVSYTICPLCRQV
jgi:hypothetical protein